MSGVCVYIYICSDRVRSLILCMFVYVHTWIGMYGMSDDADIPCATCSQQNDNTVLLSTMHSHCTFMHMDTLVFGLWNYPALCSFA